MKHIVFFSAFLTVTMVLGQDSEDGSRGNKTWKSQNCHPAFPNLSVGDVNLTAANFDKFKQDNEVFILGISDSQCDRCCYTEGLLYSILTGLQTQSHTYGKVLYKIILTTCALGKETQTSQV
jgi:hypothetical protein